MNGDQPCTCPASEVGLGRHTVADHEQDCGGTQPDEVCGDCWHCIAMQVAYHQVTATRGDAA